MDNPIGLENQREGPAMTAKSELLRIAIAGTTRLVEVAADGSRRVEGWAGRIDVTRIDATTFQVTLGDDRLLVYVVVRDGRCWAFADGCAFELDVRTDRSPEGSHQRHAGHTVPSLAAPMPATVLTVLVEPGEAVTQGMPLVLLEAMKMELAIRAPRDGVVAEVSCDSGDLVQSGVPLVTLRDENGEPAG